MNHSMRFDKWVTWLVTAVLLYSAALLISAYCDGKGLAAWVWDRHQNQFSWYSRPLFLIPVCYYAYRRNLGLILGFMIMLFCSLFWFEAPAEVPSHVSAYLDWEKQLFFSNESLIPLFTLVVVVCVFLILLFTAFWQRNPVLGLILINAGTVAKVVVSVALAKETGAASIVPSLSSLIVVNLVAFVLWRVLKQKRATGEAI